MKSKKYRLLSFIIILFLTVSLIIDGYLVVRNIKLMRNLDGSKVAVTPTSIVASDSMDGWKTYTNSQFSVRYPDTWDDPVINPLSTRIDYNFSSANLDITIGFYYDQASQKQRSYEDEVLLAGKNAVGKRNVVVDGVNTIMYIDNIGQSTTEETVILKGKGNMIIWISMPFPVGTDPSVFDQILSTFKFTDQSAMDISNWKSASDGSLKYPGNWYEGPANGEGAEGALYSSLEFSNYPFNGSGEDLFSSKDDYVLLVFNFNRSKNIGNETLMEYFNMQKILRKDTIYSNGENITVNGNQFFLVESSYKNMSNYELQAMAKKDDVIYSINLLANSEPVLESYKNTFDQILSTFKFRE